MQIEIDNKKTDYYVRTTLIGYNHDGERIEERLTNSVFDSMINWLNLPKVVVYNEFDEEVIFDTQIVNITAIKML